MKSFTKLMIPAILLLAVSTYTARGDDEQQPTDIISRTASVSGIFLQRPQGLDSAALFFDPYYWECCDEHNICGYAYLGYRYQRSFDNERLAGCLTGTATLPFGGSKSGIAGDTALMGDFVGLAPNLQSTLTFDPLIQNHIIDFYSRFDLGRWASCLETAYISLGMSLVHAQWDLGLCASTPVRSDAGSQFDNFPACYMSTTQVNAARDLTTALAGEFTFGDMKTPWKYGKFKSCSQNDTKLANFDMILGYDVIRCPRWHVGLFAKASAPTGTRPNAEYVFEPIIGNGHHWELGGGLDMHWTMWSCDERCVSAYLTGSVTHLFDDTQYRSFDFKEDPNLCSPGFFSRYVLLKEFDANGAYAGNLINAINYTTRQVKTSFDVQGDASVRLVYRNCGWAVGLGYNVFGRSAEKIEQCGGVSDDLAGKRFGIKGTGGVCARGFNINTAALTGTTVGLNTTESSLRMINLGESTPGRLWDAEARGIVDNPVLLEEETDDGLINYITWYSPTDVADSVVAYDSRPPVYVTDNDINFKGVPRMITHKLFGHIDYQWETCYCWQPYLGIGGEVEFMQRNRCSCCDPRFWSMWIHGGINF